MGNRDRGRLRAGAARRAGRVAADVLAPHRAAAGGRPDLRRGGQPGRHHGNRPYRAGPAARGPLADRPGRPIGPSRGVPSRRDGPPQGPGRGAGRLDRSRAGQHSAAAPGQAGQGLPSQWRAHRKANACWPANSRSGALLGRYPGLQIAADRGALSWAHGDGLVLRGLVSLPVVLRRRRQPRCAGPIPPETKETPMAIAERPSTTASTSPRCSRRARRCRPRLTPPSSPGGPAAPGATARTAAPPWTASPAWAPSSAPHHLPVRHRPPRVLRLGG